MAGKASPQEAPSRKGCFITFEGGEGMGKSTQAAKLRDRLIKCGLDVVLTREPGGAPGAEKIRDLLVTGSTDKWTPMSEALLHYAARREHLDRTILPALAAGKWVICDRYADSTLAYQGYAQGLGADSVLALHKLVTGDFWPELTLLLEGATSLGLDRARIRETEGRDANGEDRYERMGADFHNRLQQAFREIAAENPRRITVISASGGIDEVAARVWAAVARRFDLE